VIVHAEPVMGTMFSFHLEAGECPVADARSAVASACFRLHELDGIFSTWKPDSALSRLRTGKASLADGPAEMALVMEMCEEARFLSQGWFDPWAMPGGFDPTGLVKGWATEQALGILRAAGVKAAIVNGGGDIAVFGSPNERRPWRIGVRHPWRPEALACVLEVDRAVATSGCYERGPHLINPKDGRMVFQTASATVVGSSLPLCDALATALVVAEEEAPEIVRSLEGYEAYVIGSDGTEEATGGIVFATENAT
jgi:FAD:protein FMN transferase